MPEDGGVDGLAYAPDGDSLVTLARTESAVSFDSWSLSTGQSVGSVDLALLAPLDERAWALLSPDGSMVAVFQQGLASLYSATTGTLMPSVQRERVQGGMFSADSRLLALWDPSGADMGIWETATGVLQGTVSRCWGAMAFWPDASSLTCLSTSEGYSWDGSVGFATVDAVTGVTVAQTSSLMP